jgi:hypothetical protein
LELNGSTWASKFNEILSTSCNTLNKTPNSGDKYSQYHGVSPEIVRDGFYYVKDYTVKMKTYPGKVLFALAEYGPDLFQSIFTLEELNLLEQVRDLQKLLTATTLPNQISKIWKTEFFNSRRRCWLSSILER